MAFPGLFSYLFLVYKFKKNEGKPEFADHFNEIVRCSKRNGYNIGVIKNSAC